MVIPISVQSIGDWAFSDCDRLKKSAYPNTIENPFSKGTRISYPAKGAIIEDGWVYGPDKSAIYFAPLSLEGDFTIPGSVQTIGYSAFYNCSGLTSVVIPNSVQTIGSSAFYSCSGLTSIEIPNSVEQIEGYAFSGCSNLNSVLIGNSVRSIGRYAFQDCINLVKCAYPFNIQNPFPCGLAIDYAPWGTTLENGWLYGNDKRMIYFAPLNLEGEFIIPDYITSIGHNAFSNCEKLTSIKFQKLSGQFGIGGDAFSDCTGLRKVDFESIEDACKVSYGSEKANPLFYAHNLYIGGEETTEFIFPETVSWINPYAFIGLDNLIRVKTLSVYPPSISPFTFNSEVYENVPLDIPDNSLVDYLSTDWALFNNISVDGYQTRIYEDDILSYRLIENPEKREAIVVKGNYGELRSLKIADNVMVDGSEYMITGIGPNSFEGCSNLVTVDLSSCNHLKIIGRGAFAGCENLSKAEFANVETICNMNFGSIDANPLYYAHHLYINGDEIKDLVIPESVTKINSSAFIGCNRLNSAKVADSVTEIGSYAFAYCGRLSSVELSNSLSSIASGLFMDCTRLSSIKIPNSVRYIYPSAFANCHLLSSVEMGISVETLGWMAFSKCESLEKIVIPNSVTYIDPEVFADCSNLVSLTFSDGESPIQINGGAFNSSPVKNLYLGRPLINSYDCFPNYYITTLTIGNLVTEIIPDLFRDCVNLTSLTLGSGLKTIGVASFRGCSALTEVIIPPSVEEICEAAFLDNHSLTSIIMGHNVKKIGDMAFNSAPVSTVSITAQTPPVAYDNTFSVYTGKLYLQDPGNNLVKEAYYDADACWYRFSSYVLIQPEKIEGDQQEIEGKPGESFQLTAKVWPEDVTLPQLFWRSTNPDVATVDENGLVTIHADISEIISRADSDDEVRSCKIIAETLYADGPVLEVTVYDETSAGIDDVISDNADNSGEIDYTAPYDVYNLNGVKVATDSLEGLNHGFYIIRQGRVAKKIALN